MSFTVRTRRSAQADIRAAARWYDQQRTGLGKDFVAEVKEVVRRLSQTPRMHQIIKGHVRRALVQRFPYCVYYTVGKKVVEIIGVFHAKRDPAVWQARIQP